jgi:hypothetical protein
MQVGIELVSAVVGCGLAAGMSLVAIEGLFRLTFGRQGMLESTAPRPPVASR